MAQPPPYVPVHSFVADSATLANFPGQALDVEFQDVKTTTDAIRANLALIQRDDGALANGSVTFDTLALSLQSNGLAGAAAWVTGLAYAVGAPVYQSNNLYRCLVAHTSGVFATDLAAGKWLLLVALPAGPAGATGPAGAANVQFVFEGDSRTNTSNLGTWPLKLPAVNALFARGTKYFYATDGDTAANIVAEYPTQGGSVALAAGSEQYYLLLAGHNDIVAGATAAAIYANLKLTWAQARVSNYKVVAYTEFASGGFTAPQNVVLGQLNALILSDPTLYDFVVRLDALLVNSSDPLIFNPDLTHLTTFGNVLAAQETNRVIFGSPPVYQTPADTFAGGLQNNSAMEVSQEFGSTARTGLASGVANYIVDGYSFNVNGSGVATAQKVTDAPPGLTNSIKISVTTAVASLGASDFAFIRIPLEASRLSRLAWGSAAAQPVSIGFWAKVHRTGTYSGSVVNAAGDKSYPYTFSVNAADTWEFKTVTIPGETVGSWAASGSVGATLTVCFAIGTTFSAAPFAWASGQFLGATGTTNGIAATSDTFQITGFIVLPGIYLPSSQKLPLILRPFDQELQYCKRFWQKSYEYATAPGTATTSGAVNIFAGAAATNDIKVAVNFPVQMAGTPGTVTLYDDLGASGKVFKGASGKTGVADRLSTAGFRGASSDVTSTNELLFQWTANARQ